MKSGDIVIVKLPKTHPSYALMNGKQVVLNHRTGLALNAWVFMYNGKWGEYDKRYFKSLTQTDKGV